MAGVGYSFAGSQMACGWVSINYGIPFRGPNIPPGALEMRDTRSSIAWYDSRNVAAALLMFTAVLYMFKSIPAGAMS